jgi:ribosome-binding protein aMBF1 (putative translation factor)
MSIFHRIHIPARPAAAVAQAADPEVDMRDRIGRNLSRLRDQRGLSLLDLAALSRVSYWTLQEVELGRELPSVEVLWKLARALKISCDTFLDAPAQRHAGSAALG